jgi:hypothetical protein
MFIQINFLIEETVDLIIAQKMPSNIFAWISFACVQYSTLDRFYTKILFGASTPTSVLSIHTWAPRIC